MRRALHPWPVLLVLLLVSCDSDPEDRIDPEPPVAGDLAFWSYPDGRHVTGSLRFLVTSRDFPGLSRVEAYVDDEFQGFRDGLPELEIAVDTRPFSEGPHAVTLLVQTRDAKAELRYRGNLTFDHTPPSAGRLVALELRDDLPVVRWLRNEDANFASYRVRREALGTLPAAVFAIEDRDTTEFTDTTLPLGTAGVRLEYSIAVHNGHEQGPRDARLVVIGDLLDLSPYPGVEPVAGPLQAQSYVVDAGSPSRLVMFSATTNEVLAERQVLSGSRALACGPEGLILVYADASNLEILDAQTLDTKHARPFDDAVEATVATDGRVFVAEGGSGAAIEMFDAALTPLETIDVTPSPPTWVAVSADVTRLYAINANPRTNPLGSLLAFDLDVSPAALSHTRDLAPGFVQAVPSPGGDLIYLAHTRFVEIVDGSDLTFVDRYDTPGDISSIAVNAASLYVAFGEAPGTEEPPRIERLDRQTLARAWTWRLVGPARNLVVTRDDTRLYAYLTDPLAQMIGLDVR